MANLHTRKEIETAWENASKNQEGICAMERGPLCLKFDCDNKPDALMLCAYFIRAVCADIRCTHWDGKTVSLYYPSKDAAGARRRIAAFYADPSALDERGPLFKGETLRAARYAAREEMKG